MVGRERTLGPTHPDTLTSQNNLAATYQDVGRFAEAILLFRLTLAARERLLGADHPGTLNSRGNLASAYRATGRVAEAIPLLEQEVHPGRGPPQVYTEYELTCANAVSECGIAGKVRDRAGSADSVLSPAGAPGARPWTR